MMDQLQDQALSLWISSASSFSNPLHVTHDTLVAKSGPFSLDQLC